MCVFLSAHLHERDQFHRLTKSVELACCMSARRNLPILFFANLMTKTDIFISVVIIGLSLMRASDGLKKKRAAPGWLCKVLCFITSLAPVANFTSDVIDNNSGAVDLLILTRTTCVINLFTATFRSVAASVTTTWGQGRGQGQGQGSKAEVRKHPIIFSLLLSTVSVEKAARLSGEPGKCREWANGSICMLRLSALLIMF